MKSPLKAVNSEFSKSQYRYLGFHEYMTYEEARARQLQLNAQAEIKRYEEIRFRAQLRLKRERLSRKAYFPKAMVRDFEDRNIRKIRTDPKGTGIRQRKVIWRSVQKLIFHLKLEPWQWSSELEQIYDWFSAKGLSPSYMRKILMYLNLWGRFYCRYLNRVYEQVKAPSGHELRSIYEAYHASIGGVTRESDPLTPDELVANKNKFENATYNWLHLSVWLGLRPKEIDSLKDPEFFRFEKDKIKMPLLKIYQSKLINIPPDKRWKTISLIYPEQKKCKSIIQSGDLKRPLTRRVSKHLGDRVKLNAGRKGFVDLMISKGQDIFDISQWLGHWTVKRTWFDYKNRSEVHYCLPESGARV